MEQQEASRNVRQRTERVAEEGGKEKQTTGKESQTTDEGEEEQKELLRRWKFWDWDGAAARSYSNRQICMINGFLQLAVWVVAKRQQ